MVDFIDQGIKIALDVKKKTSEYRLRDLLLPGGSAQSRAVIIQHVLYQQYI